MSKQGFKKMKTIKTILLMSILIICACNNTSKKPVSPSSPIKTDLAAESTAVSKTKTTIGTEATSIKSQTATIKSETDSGKKEAPKMSQWDKIKESADNIDISSDKLMQETKTLGEIEVKLNTAKAEVDALNIQAKEFNAQLVQKDEFIKKQEEKIKSFEDGARKRQQTIWMSVAGICAISMFVGIFITIYAAKELGIALTLSGATMACVSYFMAAYALVVAIIGGVILLAIIAIMTRHVYTRKLELEQSANALKETVTAFEEVKKKEWDSDTKSLIGKLQSPKTKEMVHKIRLNCGIK